MESYLEMLPENVVNKIFVFNSHPVADLVRESIKFKVRKLKLEQIHGCPFDRGSADAYYYREPKPHYKRNGVVVFDLTPEEEDAYDIGYITEDRRR